MSTMASTGGGAGSSGAPASTGGTPGSTGAAPAGWGDDWRTRMAAGSTDLDRDLQQLGRYESPEQVWRKARELEKRMSSGEFRTPLKANASPEELARWRAENGIPADTKGYKINMPEGREVPKEDDPFLQSFLKSAHSNNYTQAQVDAAIKGFYAEVDRQEKDYSAAEEKAVSAADAQLRQMWGGEYELNKTLAESFLARAPAGFKDRFWNGYLEDHTPIRASTDSWKWLAQMEREINPAATVLPNQSVNLGQTIEAELTDLKKLMGDSGSKYWKGPEAEKLQARYRQLIAAQMGLKEKAKAA